MASLGIFRPIAKVAGLEGLAGVVVLTFLLQIGHLVRRGIPHRAPSLIVYLRGNDARADQTVSSWTRSRDPDTLALWRYLSST
jgi:hypothetical protein